MLYPPPSLRPTERFWTSLFRVLCQIPLYGFTQAIERTVSGRVADKTGCLIDACIGMLDIACTEWPVLSGLGVGTPLFSQETLENIEELVEACLPTKGNVVDEAFNADIVRSGRKQVSLDDVLDIAKVSAGLAVAIDLDDAVIEHSLDPARNHGCIGPIRVLPLAKDVEVTKADAVHSVLLVEYVGIEFVDVLRDRIGRERLADHVLDLRQGRMIAVG